MVKRRLLIPLLGVLLLAGAPGASAHTPDAHGCRILNASQDDVTGQDTFTGMAVAWAAAADGTGGTLQCSVRINGVTQPGATVTASGQGVIAGAAVVSYVSTATDVVEMCLRVEWADGHRFDECSPTLLIQVVPEGFADLVALAVDAANSVQTCVTIVNTGDCRSGVCYVNTGTCEGGFCVVNLNYCGRGCVAVVNTADCGRHPQAYVDP